MATKNQTIFEKINAGFADLPVVNGPRVFRTADYAKAIGLSQRTASNRINRLLEEQKVRRVRTRLNGKIVPAMEYIGK